MTRPGPALRWRNAVGIAIVMILAAGIVLAARRLTSVASPTPSNGIALQAIDLSDSRTRRELEFLAARPRADADDRQASLWHRCMQGEPDALAVLASGAWVIARHVEIRRNGGDSGATAYRWHGPRKPVPGPYRPGYPRLAESKPVSEAEYVDVAAEFRALTAAQLPAIRTTDGFDGEHVVIEACDGGRYGFFVRGAFDDAGDRRIATLAARVLKLAGIAW